MKKKIINIFGGGCAGFSFIRRSQEVKDAIFKFYLGLGNSIASLIVALLAPILGAIADRGSFKKKFLIFFEFIKQ